MQVTSNYFDFGDTPPADFAKYGLALPADYVPDHIRGSIVNYFEHGLCPGGFVTAVLANDLLRAVQSADFENRKHITSIAQWIFNNAPVGSTGSRERVQAWIEDVNGIRSQWLDRAERKLVWATLNQA